MIGGNYGKGFLMIAEIQTMTSYKNCEKTLQNAIPCVGVGVHSGKKVHMTLKPAPIGTGIVFVRTDIRIEQQRRIPVVQLDGSGPVPCDIHSLLPLPVVWIG